MPADIETRSMEIIEEELKQYDPDPLMSQNELTIVKRVIHATADFDYSSSIKFINNPIPEAIKTIRDRSFTIITDTNMTLSGINKRVIQKYEGNAICFMNDERIIKAAGERKVTRATVSMEYAALVCKEGIYSVGNAPTALFALGELIEKGEVRPSLVTAVPVGFVNVVESKEFIKDICLKREIPLIINEGRKGGSTIAAAIINAILYMADDVTDPHRR
ncbi:MAG: precorrin-8X methylmutase [Lachnospiraceae bacterium]|nr:precorrin-8X methylmutase [Lachnospiraceae bacterium]